MLPLKKFLIFSLIFSQNPRSKKMNKKLKVTLKVLENVAFKYPDKKSYIHHQSCITKVLHHVTSLKYFITIKENKQ